MCVKCHVYNCSGEYHKISMLCTLCGGTQRKIVRIRIFIFSVIYSDIVLLTWFIHLVRPHAMDFDYNSPSTISRWFYEATHNGASAL